MLGKCPSIKCIVQFDPSGRFGAPADAIDDADRQACQQAGVQLLSLT